MRNDETAMPMESIQRKIYLLRGHRIMLDTDLAEMYGTETKYLVRAVKRNPNRFPPDFAFQLSDQEVKHLRCHFGTSSTTHGGRRYAPWAFTEHGVLMLSSVLKSERAALVNVQIMRCFVEMRQLLASHEHLVERLEELEERYDRSFQEIFRVLRNLLTAPNNKNKKPIGFGPPK